MCNKVYLKEGYCNKEIDKCIQEEISNINSITENGIRKYRSLASCCGHNKYPKTIVVKDLSTNKIIEYFSKIELGKRKRNRYYKKDKEGYYFIPEIID